MAAEKNSTPTTTFNLIQRPNRSEKVVAEVEIVFGEDAGVLSGMKFVGLCIWRSDTGHLFVTPPAKPGKGGRYFDYLRPATAGHGDGDGAQGRGPPSVGGSPGGRRIGRLMVARFEGRGLRLRPSTCAWSTDPHVVKVLDPEPG